MWRWFLALFPLFFALSLHAANPPQPDTIQKDDGVRSEVVLRGLDKVTARVSELNGKVGQPIEFGRLSITLQSCWSAPADKRPEHAALLEIIENKAGGGTQMVFSGWMFASSPGLSSLEHPVYDVTVVKCQ